MTKKTCPLGEDCDLTIAWMAGRKSAKNELEAEIDALEAKLAKATDTLARIVRGDDDAHNWAIWTLAELTGGKDD